MTAFTWLNKQGVRSDTGFEFQFTGQFTVEYREHGRTTKIFVEDGVGTIMIYDGSLASLWSDIAHPEAQRRERERVLENVKDALAFQGLALVLLHGPAPK